MAVAIAQEIVLKNLNKQGEFAFANTLKRVCPFVWQLIKLYCLR
jgi:hypothetical protein